MSMRLEALKALRDITDHGAYANLRIKALSDTLDERDCKHATALIYTALDHLLYLDYLLSYYVHSRMQPVLRAILRLGVCELLFMETAPHAAVSEYVALTRRVGKSAQSGFVNAVLRNVDRARDTLPPLPNTPIERLSIQYSYPKWLVTEWVRQYGEAFTESMLSCPSAPMEVRAQYPYATEALLSALPADTEVGALDSNCLILRQAVNVPKMQPFLDGHMTVQSQSAMLVCRALGDCCGKRVLDLCAAPGGKSAYIASLAENDVQLNCCDVHDHRVELMQKTLQRLHVTADCRVMDGTAPDAAMLDAFDAVLLDAPCSGLGLTHDKPDIRYTKSPADIASLAALQCRLLEAAARCVRVGGVLVYATCTISACENEEQVQAFLGAHGNFRLDTIPVNLPNDGTLQLFPHIHHADGFFLARMIRCS